MNLVLFDCDGTLVDSAHIIHNCMEKTFLEAGFEAPQVHQTKSIIGLTLDVAIARILGRAVDMQVLKMAARYKDHNQELRQNGPFHEPFFDGIWDVLDDLRARDEILIGIVTGKSRRGLNTLIDKHDLNDAIIASRTADECPSKPHPAMVLECCEQTGVRPEQTVVIGDAIYDIEMARSAGATAIGVSWGYGDTASLEGAGAHEVLHEPAAILPLIDRHQAGSPMNA